jgi:hypothetical protein
MMLMAGLVTGRARAVGFVWTSDEYRFSIFFLIYLIMLDDD